MITENLLSIENSMQQMVKWIEKHEYKGYDPFDGLLSFLRPLTFHNMLAERILQQTVRQCPLNIRPLLGIKPQESPIGRGYMAAGYLKMFKLTGNPDYRKKAINTLHWLTENKSPAYEKYSWGNHFDYASRSGGLPKFEPTIVWTSLIGQAFLDAYEILGEDKYLRTAINIAEWILDLPKEKTDKGSCLSYVANEQLSIHNSNMLGAAMLARVAKFTGHTKASSVAKESIEYTCSRQLLDGSWYYGNEPKYHWVDNFHTGYNLESLKCYIDNSRDMNYDNNLKRGFKFYKMTFFEATGRPKYYYNRLYPVDIQCVAQAIETLADFSEYDASALELSLKVARWAIGNMQNNDGYFYYRLYPLNVKDKTPMIHWGQATTYKALAVLLSKGKIIKKPADT